MQVEGRKSKAGKRQSHWQGHHGPWLSAFNFRRAFTLIELLVVIVILGIIAGLALPAIKDLGKTNINISASRQLLDDVGRARQLAMSQRTTVYMVFLPTNFWLSPQGTFGKGWWTTLTPGMRAQVTNLLDKQQSGYNFYSIGRVGDQPGQHQPQYLLPAWRTLPAGTFIASQKFISPFNSFSIPAYNSSADIYGFKTNIFHFPTATNSAIILPYIAFNYLGQLTFDGQTLATNDEYIPLAHGSVLPAVNADKDLILGPADISEMPPGNSTNSAYNIIKIDALTGRPTLLYQKVQ